MSGVITVASTEPIKELPRICDDREEVRPGYCQNHPEIRAMPDGSGLCYECNR